MIERDEDRTRCPRRARPIDFIGTTAHRDSDGAGAPGGRPKRRARRGERRTRRCVAAPVDTGGAPDQAAGHPTYIPRRPAHSDTWIAARCLAYDLPLATHNLKDFKDFTEHHGLRLIEL
jgi:hypothetical protein